MVDPEVVDAADGDLGGGALEARHAVTGHPEVDHDVGDGAHRLVRGDLQGGLQQVAVEDHVQVLVVRDLRQQLLAERVTGEVAGVAVRDAGGELLEGHVRDRLQHALRVVGLEALRHVDHAGPLQLDRVHGPGGQQVVPERYAVPALLGGPAVHPGAPGALAPEHGGDLVVVAREVVLGQQVHHERDPAERSHLRLLQGPRLAAEHAVEVAAQAPRDVLVGHPLLGDLQVAVELGLHHLLEGEDQTRVGPGGRTGR